MTSRRSFRARSPSMVSTRSNRLARSRSALQCTGSSASSPLSDDDAHREPARDAGPVEQPGVRGGGEVEHVVPDRESDATRFAGIRSAKRAERQVLDREVGLPDQLADSTHDVRSR